MKPHNALLQEFFRPYDNDNRNYNYYYTILSYLNFSDHFNITHIAYVYRKNITLQIVETELYLFWIFIKIHMKYSILILLGVRAQVAEYQDICMNKLFYFEVLGLDEIYEILVEFVILRKRRKLRKFYFQKHGLVMFLLWCYRKKIVLLLDLAQLDIGKNPMNVNHGQVYIYIHPFCFTDFVFFDMFFAVREELQKILNIAI